MTNSRPLPKLTPRKAEELSFTQAFKMFLGFSYEEYAKSTYYKENKEILESYMAMQYKDISGNCMPVADIAQAIYNGRITMSTIVNNLSHPVHIQEKDKQLLNLIDSCDELCRQLRELPAIENIEENILKTRPTRTAFMGAMPIVIACLAIAALCLGVIARDKLPFGDKIINFLSKAKIEQVNIIFGGAAAAATAFAFIAVGVAKGYNNYQQGKLSFLDRQLAEECLKYCYSKVQNRPI